GNDVNLISDLLELYFNYFFKTKYLLINYDDIIDRQGESIPREIPTDFLPDEYTDCFILSKDRLGFLEDRK
ncbi:MAG: hypothetical protein KGS48_07685, partial [Bacteroidetes bacterium]|nr:hypothetical protein [Bacteroidota bacterium]